MPKKAIFIMGAGIGERLPHNIGEIIPKCLLPVVFFDEQYNGNDLIIDRIVVSVNRSCSSEECDIHIMISNRNVQVANYLAKIADNVTVHTIAWSESSISTFNHCASIIQDNDYDSYVFINADMLIYSLEKSLPFIKDVLLTPNTCLAECHSIPKYLWSSIICDENGKLATIFPDYCETTLNLCDMTHFSKDVFEIVKQRINTGFEHKWWEMAFIELINNKKIEMSAIIANNAEESVSLFHNVNEVTTQHNKYQIFDILINKLHFMKEGFEDA